MHILRSRTTLTAVAGLLVVGLAIGATAAILSPGAEAAPLPSPTLSPSASPTASPTPSPSPTPTPAPAAYCPLSGLPLGDAALAERMPMLVQVENNPIARPPSGLNLADLVIEAPVEGNTTRFSAVYACHSALPAAVGPVRSMRYFNLDLWQQLRGLTFGFGGGWAVLNRFGANGMPYVNGIEGNFDFYHRTGPWPAPHNVYLDVDAARSAIEPGGRLEQHAALAGEPRGPFAFDDDPALPDDGRPVGSVELQTASIWRFGWESDAETGDWLRTDDVAPNFDAITNERLSARSVLVQLVREEVLWNELDASGSPRRDQYLVDDGAGVLYVDGHAYDLRWSRPSSSDLTTWTYAASGDPLVLPRGRVWWEIVPVGSTVTEE
ncbi:MAG: DUF3048 domain-containing protein [Candidatus Limnocylindria bacterium]